MYIKFPPYFACPYCKKYHLALSSPPFAFIISILQATFFSLIVSPHGSLAWIISPLGDNSWYSAVQPRPFKIQNTDLSPFCAVTLVTVCLCNGWYGLRSAKSNRPRCKKDLVSTMYVEVIVKSRPLVTGQQIYFPPQLAADCSLKASTWRLLPRCSLL